MVNFTLPAREVGWLLAVVLMALTDATLNVVLAIIHLIKGIKARKRAKKAGYVKITGDKYANGHTIPKWVKSASCIVAKTEGDNALLCAPLGWVNINDFSAADTPDNEGGQNGNH